MRLQRKLFAIQPGYYDGLNEAEKDWLEKKRSKIAKSIEKDKQKLKSEGKFDKNARINLLKKLRNETIKAEKIINGGKAYSKPYRVREVDDSGRFSRYIREAVNNVYQDKQLEKAKAIELTKKKAAESAEKVAKLKKLGKGALVVGGTALGIGLGTKTIKNYKDRKKQEQTKNSVLGKK